MRCDLPRPHEPSRRPDRLQSRWLVGFILPFALVLGVAASGPPPTFEKPVAGVWTTSSTAIPATARLALSAIKRLGRPIQTFALTPSNEWVIVAANQPYYSPGFPAAIKADIDRYVQNGKQIDVIAFSTRNQWVVIAEDWLHRSTSPSIPSAANDRIRSLQSQGGKITSFAFSPADPNGWVLTAAGVVYTGGNLPRGLSQALVEIRPAKLKVQEVAVGPTGAWVVVAGNWFMTSGISTSLWNDLDRYRTDEGRRIDHVALNVSGSTFGWAIISNDEFTPGTDRMSRLESGLLTNQSIYARMKANQIVGVSLAVVENNQISQVRSYGLRNANQPESYVLPNTVFEAASISKPLSAFAALQLVDDGRLNAMTKGILAPVALNLLGPADARTFLQQFSDVQDIHLADILSHCAGIRFQRQLSDVRRTGVESFSSSATLPSIKQMLMGQNPADQGYRPVQQTAAGDNSVYSGANYYLTQAIIQNYSSDGYDRRMAALLSSLGMRSSSFVTPAPGAKSDNFARGHTANRKPTPVLAFPGKAGASLSTTAGDLAQWVIMLNNGGMSGGATLLSSRRMEEFMGQDAPTRQSCSTRGNMQLGIRRRNGNTWYHRGTHNGYRSYFFARPADRWGLVVLMTGPAGGNSPSVDAFAGELLDAVEAAYTLPDNALVR